MKGLLDSLRTERSRAWNESRAILGKYEGRDLSSDDLSSFNSLLAQVDDLDRRINVAKSEIRREDEAAEVRNDFFLQERDHRDPTAFRRRDGLSEGDRQFVAALRGKRDYTFEVRMGDLFTPDALPELRELDAGSGDGSNLVPVQFLSQLSAYLIADSRIKAAGAKVISTDHGHDVVIPKRTAIPSVSGITSEGSAIAEADPTFGAGTLHAYKLAALQQVSTELYEDADIPLIGQISQDTGEAISNAAGSLYVTGTGSGQPEGFLTNIGGGTVTGGTGQGGTVTSDELLKTYYALPIQYRKSASWFFSDTQLQAVRELTDSQGRYLVDLQDGLADGSPGSLMGRPVFVDPYVPAAATSATSIAFGDFSRGYWIRETPLTFVVSRDYAFNQDLVTLRTTIRTDGRVIDPNAFSVYVGGTA